MPISTIGANGIQKNLWPQENDGASGIEKTTSGKPKNGVPTILTKYERNTAAIERSIRHI